MVDLNQLARQGLNTMREWQDTGAVPEPDNGLLTGLAVVIVESAASGPSASEMAEITTAILSAAYHIGRASKGGS